MRTVHIFLLACALAGCEGDSANFSNGERDVSSRSLPVTILAQGNQPTIGNTGPRELRVIVDQTEFANTWFDYTTDDLPEIDFDQTAVVLRDRGYSNLNHCGGIPTIDRVTAMEYDETVAEVSFHLKLSQRCPPVACLAFVQNGRPYIFASVPATSDVTVRASEEIEIETCDDSALPPGFGQTDSISVSTLAEGVSPVEGVLGPRRSLLINNAEDLQQIWSRYVEAPPPDIDFGDSAVILYDEGFSDSNACPKRTSLTSVGAEQALSPFNTEVTTVGFNTAVDCDTDRQCEAAGPFERHFRFVRVDSRYNSFAGDMLISETLSFPLCRG